MRPHSIALLGAAAVSMIAATAVETIAARQPIRRQMTCAEFLRSDDGVKPEIVYWFATRPTLGTRDAEIDVEATDSMVPILVDRCSGAPESLVSRQVDAEARHLRRRQESP